MKLTVYLLREDVTELEDVIPQRHTQSGAYHVVSPRQDLPFLCHAWVQQNKTKPPRWLEWLSSAFELGEDDLLNQSNSFVLALEAAGRRFAVTFGYGFSVVDRALVEPDFGLKVTLNIVDPQALDTLDTRTLDRVTRQTRTHLNAGRPVEDFGIEPDLDWLRSVKGEAEGEGITGKVQGSDSVRVNWDGGIESLGACCEQLLELYQSDRYRDRFAFVDHLRPLSSADPLVAELEKALLRVLRDRDREWLSVAHPDVPSPDVETYKIWCGYTKHEDIDELDLDAVFAFLDEYQARHGEAPDLHKTWVIALDGQGEARTRKTAVWTYLVAHVEHASHMYVLSLAQWFQTDRDYIDHLRREVTAIDDVTDELGLPPWPKGTTEAEYNSDLASGRDWLLLDRQMFTFGDGTRKIECADLLTPDPRFLHVKSMTSSATLSHLFAQGSVSARLYCAVPGYRQAIADTYRIKYREDLQREPPPQVVYVIGTAKTGALADTLFFFSLVNLVQHKEALDAMRCPVAVCRIARTTEG